MIDFSYDEPSSGITVVQLRGQLDEPSFEYFSECMESLVDAGVQAIVIDCRQIRFMSSLELGGLMKVRKRVKAAGGRVCLAHVNSLVAELLAITGLRNFFSIQPSTEAAVRVIERTMLAAV
jgi:anti-sigma B factor antagonist